MIASSDDYVYAQFDPTREMTDSDELYDSVLRSLKELGVEWLSIVTFLGGPPMGYRVRVLRARIPDLRSLLGDCNVVIEDDQELIVEFDKEFPFGGDYRFENMSF